MSAIALIRGILLVFGMGALLAGTILFPFVRRGTATWLRLAGQTRAGARGRPSHVMALAANAMFLRAWQLFMAAVLLTAWWYFGTAAGAARLLSALGSH